MRPPDYRCFDQVGVAQQHLLDLAWVDVAAATDNHVLRAVAQRQQSVLVHAPDIAGMEPAAAQRFGIGLRVPPVAIHDAVAASDDLTDLAPGHLAVILVDHPYQHPTAWIAARG